MWSHLRFSVVATLTLRLLTASAFRNSFRRRILRPTDSSCFFESLSDDARQSAQQDDYLTEFPEELVQSLDLRPLMEAVSRHAGTRRGRQSLLALVGADFPENPQPFLIPGQQSRDAMSAKSRRLMANTAFSESKIKSGVSRDYRSFIAQNQDEAQKEYDVVAQALSLLNKEEVWSYPPIYGSESTPFDTENAADTDYDSWLEFSAEESTLEHVLQAEKVIETFRLVKNWASLEDLREKAPLLVEIANKIPVDELNPIYDAITAAVKISRVRTLTNPGGKSSFSFQLNEEKFHVIKVLRNQVEEAGEKLNKGGIQKSTLENDFAVLLENLDAAEDEIRRSLFQLIIGNSADINLSMNIVARLDILFAKAAFAQRTGGLVPAVGNTGEISVEQFVHPVLLCSEAEGTSQEIVPIDLMLSSTGSKRALIISGPNGGGKTAAAKSFAMAAILCKLGLPIPCRQKKNDLSLVPLVDFFNDIHVSLGDRQSLIDGESTMMAQLNACASILERVLSKAASGRSSMVLFDELGGGTDPTAGGAIAQAIVEKLLEVEGCRVVATTHIPRLKVLSYKSDQFGCATVLLEPSSRGKDDNEYQRPAYHLLYDSIGDSYALGAASRTTPSLPKDVLSRAAHLVATPSTNTKTNGESETPSNDGSAYLQVLTESMDRQAKQAKAALADADKYKRGIIACQKAMLAVASSFDREFLLLERRLEEMFETLQENKASDFELVGNTLSELRLTRKQVKSQTELLREKGLKLLPDWQDLQGGDTVVIASEDKMNGLSATVVSSADLPGGIVLKPDDVVVTPSYPSWGDAAESNATTFEPVSTLIVKRSQIAVWDYDSVWEDDALDDSWGYDVRATSVKDSKRKLNDILSTIKTTSSNPLGKASKPSTPKAKTFSSARERKAAAKQKSKKKQRKQ